MLLSQLSPSELREIASYLLAADIWRLCMCGTSALANKLIKNGGAVDLTFGFGATPRRELWPSWLRDFAHLNSLTFYDYSSHLLPPVTAEHLLSLPKELTSLTLIMSSAVQAFCSARMTDQPRYEHLTTLILQNSENIPAENVEEVSWPTNLQTLDLGDVTASRLDVTMLPPTLTHLRGWFKSMKPVPEDKVFPGTLKTVVLEFSTELSIDVVSKLSHASSLKTLSVNFPPQPNNKPRAKSRPPLISSGSEFLNLLPRSIEYLEFLLKEAIHINDFQLLPPGLKHIRGILPPTLYRPHFPKLPPSLTYFRGRVPASEAEFVTLRWPCTVDPTRSDENGLPLVTGGIKKLRLSRPEIGLPHYPIVVPASVTRMSLDFAAHDVDGVRYSVEGPIVLPPSITNLKIRDGYATPLKVMKKGLPPHLKVFTNLNGFGSAKCLRLLPRSITVLNAILYGESSGVTYDPETALALPPTLTKLSLGPFCLSTFTWINNLPQTLTDLNLNIVAPYQQPMDVDAGVPIVFPSKVTKLQLRLGRIDFVGRLLDHLPGSLLVFKLTHKSLPVITNEDLLLLPRTLQHLVLDRLDILTEACLPTLPPNLTGMYIGYDVPSWFVPKMPQNVAAQ